MLELGGPSGNILEVEAQKASRVTLRGVDYDVYASFAKGMQSGVIGAGASANSPVFSLRYTGSQLLLVRRVRVSVSNIATAFAAGVARLDLFAARAFSASDTSGTAATLTGNNGKLRTSMTAAPGIGDLRIANTGVLSAGTRTLDSDALASIAAGVVATAGIGIVPPNTPLFDARPGEHPIALVNNEGIVIQATVPATGTWALAVSVDGDEVPLADW
jgi:hypothetical protein